MHHLKFQKMRFHLIVISISLLAIGSCATSESYTKEELLDSFYKSPAYKDYEKENPITSQVVVIIEVDGIDGVFSFPNPYAAYLFEDFLKTKKGLSYSSRY